MIGRWTRLALSVLLLAQPARAQDSTRTPTPSPATPMRVPFGVGETLEYDVRFKGGLIPKEIHVGNGTMEVLPMDTVRGHDTWHTVFRISGGIPMYRVNDRYEDWLDVYSLASLRYWQDIDEGSYEPKRRYEIFPDRQEYVENDKPPRPSVANPLADVSFIYLLRTIPLRIGLDTSFNNYFMADRNPVRLKVLRRDTIEIRGNYYPTIVIQPTFVSKGLFSEGGHAEVWLSDDENHILLQMKSKVKFGSLNLYIKSYRPSPTTNISLPRVAKPR
jgi:hypothetical protein